MSTADIATQLDQHRQQAAALQAQLDQQQAVEQTQREQRLQVHDKQTVDAYPAEEEALRTEEQQAREDFIAAVLADPVFAAWATYRACRWRRTYLRDHAANAARTVGAEGPTPLAYRDPRLLEDLLQLCEDAARDVAAIESDERTNARTDAGNGQAS